MIRLQPLAHDRHASFGITSAVDDGELEAVTLQDCVWVLNVDHVGCTRRNHIASSDEGCDSATGVPSNAQHGTPVVSPLSGSESSHLLPMPVLD